MEHSGAIQIILKPGWYSGAGTTGTTHGTWNPYDAHIPLLFMGWGVNHGNTTRETHMTDIAATVAALLHIQAPNGCIGKPISEVMGKW
jgi:phosphopentomutase